MKNIKYFKVLYFLSLILVLFTGISIGSSAFAGFGLLLLFNSRILIISAFLPDDKIIGLNKKRLLFSLFFLGISLLVLFSLSKTIVGILFRGQTVVIIKWVPLVSAIGSLLFEIFYRIGLCKKNRIAAILLLVIFIQSAGSYILGGLWIYSDLFLGFLSFLITAILSSRNIYLELADILS